MEEQSAGCVLIWEYPELQEFRALLIRVRQEGYELPKGHIEEGESPVEAALRELKEETGISTEFVSDPARAELGTLRYSFQQAGGTISKTVTYFLILCPAWENLVFSRKPSRTRELHWIREEELVDITFVNDALRPIVEQAFATARQVRLP